MTIEHIVGFVQGCSHDARLRLMSRYGSGSVANPGLGKALRQLDVSSISYRVFDVTSSVTTVIGPTSLTVPSVLNDTLDADPANWDAERDPYGWNFFHLIPPSAFPNGNKKYRVEYTITLTNGAVGRVALRGTAEPTYS